MKLLKITTIIAIVLLIFSQVLFAVPLPNAQIQGSDVANYTLAASNMQCTTSASGAITGEWEFTDNSYFHLLTSLNLGSMNLCTNRNYTLTITLSIYGSSCSCCSHCGGQLNVGVMNAGWTSSGAIANATPCNVNGGSMANCTLGGFTVYGSQLNNAIPIYYENYSWGSNNWVTVDTIYYSAN